MLIYRNTEIVIFVSGNIAVVPTHKVKYLILDGTQMIIVIARYSNT